MEIPVEKYADKIIDKIPRKISGSIIGALIVGYYAVQGVVFRDLILMVIIIMTGIITHGILEFIYPTQDAEHSTPNENETAD